jgi:hypothetical protein
LLLSILLSQQQIYHCQPDLPLVPPPHYTTRSSTYIRFYTNINMYTSIFAILALAASTIAAPAPIEKRQGAITCGSVVSVFTNQFHPIQHHPFPSTKKKQGHVLFPPEIQRTTTTTTTSNLQPHPQI